MVDLHDVRIGLEECSQLCSVVHLLLDSEGNGLKSSDHLEAWERICRSTEQHPHRTNGLDDLMACGHAAKDDVGMAAHELGHGGDDDISAKGQRLNGNSGGEGVVHHQKSAVLMSLLSNCRDVDHVHGRVSADLGVDHLSVRLDRCLDVLDVIHVNEIILDAELCIHLAPYVEGLAIDELVADHMIARVQKGTDSGGDGSHTGGEDQGILVKARSFHSGAQACQNVSVRVVSTNIGITLAICFFDLAEGVSGKSCCREIRE